jgi:autotransporter-associated beta strand protein
MLEQLEDRTVPATFTWTGLESTLWSDADNWGEHRVPGAADPEKDDVLVFPKVGAVNFTSVNDIGAVNAAQIQMLGNSYDISGGTIRLDTNNLATSALLVQGSNSLSSNLELLTTTGDIVFEVTEDNTLRFAGIISGAGGFVKRGTGTIGLEGSVDNTYSGNTSVDAGVLKVFHPGALGATTAGTTVHDPGTLQLDDGSSGGTEPLTLGGAGGSLGASAKRGALNLSEATSTTYWYGDITLTTTAVFVRVDSFSTSVLSLNGRISGDRNGLTKVGDGTLVFAGSNSNDYTGSTLVNEGFLYLGKSSGINAFGGSLTIGNQSGPLCRVVLLNDNQIPDNTAVTINYRGILDLASIGRSDTIGPLELTGRVTTGSGVLTLNGNVNLPSSSEIQAEGAVISGHLALGGVTRTFTVGSRFGSPELVIDAIISGTAGEGLTKAGGGELTLSGANTYTGTTSVNEGALNVDGDQQKSLVLISGFRSTLSGDGTIGSLKVNSGGTVKPGFGNSLTVHGNANLFPNSIYVASLDGTDFSRRLTATGSLSINGVSLQLRDTSVPVGTKITIMSATSITGTFSGVANNGIVVDSSGNSFRVTYTSTSVAVTRINGPAFQDRAITSPINEGRLATLTGHITTILPDDKFYLEVNWGDGSRTETFKFQPKDPREVVLQHRYLDDGVYSVGLLWRDQRGSFNTDALTLTVLNVDFGDGTTQKSEVGSQKSEVSRVFSDL